MTWNCLSITCYGFTSHSLRDRHNILTRWRERSMRIITTSATVPNFILLIIYSGNTLAFLNNTLPVKNHYGSISNYRNNLFNLYTFVSNETYNTHYYTCLFVDMLFVVRLCIIISGLDFLIVSLCLGICCQMQMISVAFKSVGRKPLGDHLLLIGEYGFWGARTL